MSLISPDYLKMNQYLHRKKKYYGAGGHKWREKVIEIIRRYKTQDMLDYGCGKGTLNDGLSIRVFEYDPAIEGKDSEPAPADLVVCTDVLEHIEPEYLDSVLEHIKSLTKVVGFFVIATRHAQKDLPDGRNAHLIVQPRDWWLDKLATYFSVEEVQDSPTQKGEFSVIVTGDNDDEKRAIHAGDRL